jgi:DNA-directed RNA polymerase specialized sigma24 family protein
MAEADRADGGAAVTSGDRRGGASCGVVAAAAAGDQRAWDALVDCFAEDVWATARSHGLDAGEAADVSVLVWLRLADALATLRSDDEVAAWLRVVACEAACDVVLRGPTHGAGALESALAD